MKGVTQSGLIISYYLQLTLIKVALQWILPFSSI